MEEFLKNLQSPSWWVGTIVVGILVNLATPLISRSLEKFSSSWADKRRKQREERDKRHHKLAVAMRTSPSWMLLIVAQEQRNRSNAIIWALFACFCMGVALYAGRKGILPDTPWYEAGRLFGGVFAALSGVCTSFAIRALGQAAINQSILRQSWSGTNIEKAMKAQMEADAATVTDAISAETLTAK
ncbi:hypothetical protein [Cupriavidus sp. D39]|uniref:hypothetical protein n=1 Tax=Cupriavidus sp. D39 TaxID=2997877 RepID=UPI00226D8681|nr:hypothetical protein [Cupriavidus sp. D39]MCY0856017.1 hypothetical protein [Cupriavidus sp. D39]